MVSKNNNDANLTLDSHNVYIGGCGLGKTSFMKKYFEDCVKLNESVFIIDYIKDFGCLKNENELIADKKLIVIDLSSKDSIQGLGYNEALFNSSMTELEKLNLAELQTKEFLNLIKSANLNTELEEDVLDFFKASSRVVFTSGRNNVKDVFNFVENGYIKSSLVENLSDYEKQYLKEDLAFVENMYTINGSPGNGMSSSIKKINDLISIFKEDSIINSMYNTDSKNNINFVDCIEQGMVVLIKGDESLSLNKTQLNILTSFFMGKIWLSAKIRAMKSMGSISTIKRCNVFLDELIRTPSCINNLEYMIQTSRVLGVKFVLSAIHPGEIEVIRKPLEDCNSKFLILARSSIETFNSFNTIISQVSADDFKLMPKYQALCLTKNADGYYTKVIKSNM